jgi:hypothetical protein
MMLRWRAGHLPGPHPAGLRWHTLAFEAHGRRAEIEVPAPAADQVRHIARGVREAAHRHLRQRPVDAVIRTLDQAVARLLDPADPWRKQADDLLPIVSGYDAEMVRLALTGYLHSFRAPQLQRFVAEDFPNPKVLDGFQPAVKGGAVRAFGPSLLAHSWAGNVPGLPLWSLACGLLVKAGNVGKLPSAEPVFASLFAQLLAQIDPELAACLAVVWWKGGDRGPSGALFAEADTVLAYGGNAALQEVREQVPVSSRFLGYGHKVGVALVGRAALDPQRGPVAARLTAHDVARYEQQGCYSPHVVYVERGGALSPAAFAQYLAADLQALAHRHPRRALALEEAAAVAAWRQAAEWGGHAPALILGDEQSSWSVVVHEQPQPLAPSAGQRCVTVCAVDALDDVAPLLAPHAAFLQTVGLATTPAELYRLADMLGAAGVTRIAPLGAMTQPEPGWHHDGRFNLADLVRMVEIEGAAERAADALAPYAQELR